MVDTAAEAFDVASMLCGLCRPTVGAPPVLAEAQNPVPVPQPEPIQPDQLKPCPVCGEQIKAEAIKCRHCGEFVDPQQRMLIKGAKELLPKFQKGVRGLGSGLILLGLLNMALAGFMTRLLVTPQVFFMVGVGVFILVLGVLLYCRQMWANHIAFVLFLLLIVLNVVEMARADSASTGLVVLRFLIPIIVLVSASGNIKHYAAIQKAGLDPWEKPADSEKSDKGSDVARPLR